MLVPRRVLTFDKFTHCKAGWCWLKAGWSWPSVLFLAVVCPKFQRCRGQNSEIFVETYEGFSCFDFPNIHRLKQNQRHVMIPKRKKSWNRSETDFHFSKREAPSLVLIVFNCHTFPFFPFACFFLISGYVPRRKGRFLFASSVIPSVSSASRKSVVHKKVMAWGLVGQSGPDLAYFVSQRVFGFSQILVTVPIFTCIECLFLFSVQLAWFLTMHFWQRANSGLRWSCCGMFKAPVLVNPL